MISGAVYAALPAPIRRFLPELDRCRAQADYVGLREKFDDVWILGNEEMKSRVGAPYNPTEILQTLLKYD